jgi:hypothetical protein
MSVSAAAWRWLRLRFLASYLYFCEMIHVEHQGKVKFLTASGMEFLIEQERNVKYKFLWCVLGDAGLRVTEALSLQWRDLDFSRRIINVKTLKQRGDGKGNTRRIVPMTERLVDFAGLYFKSCKVRPEQQDFVFRHPDDPAKPVSRQWVDQKLKFLKPDISAHTLRHSFGAKQAAAGTSLETTARLLGHSGTDVTFQFYYHMPERVLRAAVERTEPAGFWVTLRKRFFPKKFVHIQPMAEGLTRFHVGRKQELLRLADLSEKKVNVLLVGAQGVGKSHLLQNLKIEKVLRADEVANPKKFVGGMLLMLHEGDKDAVIDLVTKNADIKKYIQSETLGNLVECLISVTNAREYTLLIDDVSQLTPGGLKVMEKLRTHFHIIAAARAVKLDKLTGFTNFERIELQPLTRPEAHEFAELAATRLAKRVEDFEHLKEYLFRQTKGNPGYMLELIERLDVETDLSVERVQAIEHIAARQGVAIFPFVVIGLACMTALRYIGRGAGVQKDFLMMLAGVGLLALFFGREILRRTKRRNL